MAVTKRDLEIRTENRYTLHPLGKKKCTRCENIYDKTEEYFDIHNLKSDGTYLFAGQCKPCMAAIRAERKIRQKQDGEWYFRHLIAGIRCRSKTENLKFNLTAKDLLDLWNMQNGKCYYTGESLNLLAETKTKLSPHVDFPSVDKLIPNNGYVVGNVVWCKWGVNRMKSNLTKDEFITWCKLIAERM